jgi:hypothetical protein
MHRLQQGELTVMSESDPGFDVFAGIEIYEAKTGNEILSFQIISDGWNILRFPAGSSWKRGDKVSL